MPNNCYLLYSWIWGDDRDESSHRELVGVILAPNPEIAAWKARVAKISYDEIRTADNIDDYSTIFKIEP